MSTNSNCQYDAKADYECNPDEGPCMMLGPAMISSPSDGTGVCPPSDFELPKTSDVGSKGPSMGSSSVGKGSNENAGGSSSNSSVHNVQATIPTETKKDETTSSTGSGNNICFLWYINADNLLESSMRQNLQDYMASPAISAPNVQSWVYFDALNFPANEEEADKQRSNGIVTTPLENVWQDESTLLTDASHTKHPGSMYMAYDHDLSKMMVKKTIPDELDSDDPATMWGFVGYSMQQCLSKASDGTTTEMMLILSGYGDGSAGLGGDIHPRRRRQRHLGSGENEDDLEVEDNKDIVLALRTVLDDLGSNAPARIAVIGLEGNYMSNFHVVNDFQAVTDYILASESLIPEHGM